MKSEIEKAILSLKNNKASVTDNIYGKVLKLIYEMDDQFLNTLTDVFNNSYNTGKFPKDWLESTFITVPKKRGAQKCNEFLLVSLRLTTSLRSSQKLFVTESTKKNKANISVSQFGFRIVFGTGKAIFSLQVLIQRCRDMNKDTILYFLDFAKVFDNVRHERLMENSLKS